MNASPHHFGKHLADSDSAAANLRLRIGDHVVDLGALRVVTNPGAPRLTSKAAGVLLELARHAGDTVTRDQLLDRVWKDRVTTPDVLTQAIKELRRAFADDARPPRYIETVPKVGYRLIALVSAIDTPSLRIASDTVVPGSANDDAGVDVAVEPVVRASAARTRRMVRYLIGLGVATIVAIGVLPMLRHQPQSGAAPAETRWRATDVRAITSDPGPERRPRVSPDGTRIVYSQMDPATGFERLLVRGVDQSSAVHITPRAIAHEEVPAWSPDGTRIAFERLVDKTEACTMFIVPSMGGAETEVGPCDNYLVNYFDWTPDGKGLITVDQRAAAGSGWPLAVLDLSSGKKTVLEYERAASDQDLDPRYSPDGTQIGFRRGMSPHSDIFVMPASGGAVRQLTHIDARIAGISWTADGRALVFAANLDGATALYVVDIDDAAMTPLGVRPAIFPDVGRSGSTVAYEVPRTKTQLAFVPLGTQARPDELALPQLLARSTGSDTAPAFAPDGKAIAFVSDRNGSQQIWMYNPDDGAEAYAMTDFKGALISSLQFSDDGTQLLGVVRIGSNSNLVRVDVATRRRSVLAASQNALSSASYGPEPDSYLLIRRTPQAHSELILLEHADSAAEKTIPLAPSVAHVELDRSARMLYYTKFDALGVFRRPLDGGAEQVITRNIASTTMDGWRVVDGRVWYVTGMMLKPFDVREVDPQTGAERLIVRVNAWLQNVNFSVSPAHDRVLFAPLGPEDIDIGALNLATARR